MIFCFRELLAVGRSSNERDWPARLLRSEQDAVIMVSKQKEVSANCECGDLCRLTAI
jgi:hypothetical protein